MPGVLTRVRLFTHPLVLAALLAAAPAAAQVYKWVDGSGHAHFTDRPPDKKTAELMELRVNTYNGAPVLQQLSKTMAALGAGSSKVVLYGTSWCGQCKRARSWLRQRGIAFSDYDIETSTQAQQEYRQMGITGVPVIVVGRQRMLGFGEAHMQQMLDAPH